MGNIGTYMREQYKSMWIAKGESQGIAIGESRGILLSAKKLYDRGYPFEEIEDVLGITEEELMNYMKQEN